MKISGATHKRLSVLKARYVCLTFDDLLKVLLRDHGKLKAMLYYQKEAEGSKKRSRK